VVQAGRFEQFLKMVLGWLCLVHEVTFSGRYAVLTRVAGFLVIAAIAGYYGDTTGLALLPFLATLSALNGGLGWCSSATISGRVHIAWDEGGPNHLLARGMLSSSLPVFDCLWPNS
jgi:hypothetical protein